ncbi:flagellar basal body-associated protein FliL [Falsihalocynthiibacter sp. SS001]|uniref:flagellar basal body-associated protein FliL n=1 Tax=Falsihalocynthiibacter sp. SS001 TaxID=3349698 RepID=UPI0036D31EAA
MKIILFLVLTVLGVGGGIAGGLTLRELAAENDTCTPTSDEIVGDIAEPRSANLDESLEYVKLSNQFVVPTINDGQVGALVVMVLNLEVVEGYREKVLAFEPKLRNAFLLVLFDHANAGGFGGVFTSSNNLVILQNLLLEVAKTELGNAVTDVLISDVVRQDVAG